MGELVAFLVLMVAAGYGLRKAGLLRPEAAGDLNAIVLWLTLPALILEAVHGVPLTPSLGALPALAWVSSLAVVGAGMALARPMGLAPTRAGAFVLALAFGNTTYLGYPVIGAFFPPPAPQLSYAILYDQLGTTLAVNTLGVLVASRFAGQAADLGGLLRRLGGFPPIWALLLALATHGFAYPAPLSGVLHGIGALTVPLMLLAMGLTLRFGAWRLALPWVGAIALGKLVLLPLGVWGLAAGMGLAPPLIQAAVLEAAMPTMFFALTLALTFGLEAPLVVNAIALTTLLSLVTLPAWHWLLSP